VVVTDACGVAEFVKKSRAGDVVHAGDANALANALKPYLLDPSYARAVGERAREAVRCELDPDRIAEHTEQLYERSRVAFHRPKARTQPSIGAQP
jgi:glycogen(starch) synthase